MNFEIDEQQRDFAASIDAALGAANLLCFGDRDLSDPDQWEEAILNYNQSREYLDKVAHAANAYSVPQPAR